MARHHLYIDIETIPADHAEPPKINDPEFIVAPKLIECPKSYKKPETIYSGTIKNWHNKGCGKPFEG